MPWPSSFVSGAALSSLDSVLAASSLVSGVAASSLDSGVAASSLDSGDTCQKTSPENRDGTVCLEVDSKKKDTLYIYIDLLTLVPTELRFFLSKLASCIPWWRSFTFET